MNALRLAAACCALAAGASAQWLHDPQAYPTGDQPHVAASGDLDGDGRPDLVVLAGGDGFGTPATLTVMLGAPDGTLGFGTILFIGDHVNAVRVGDVTGDGVPDVVVSSAFFQQLDVYAGDGKGGLLPPVHAGTHTTSDVFALGDLDLDGALDSVTGNSLAHSVTLMHNTAGTLAATAIVPVPGTPQSVAIVRMDGDALPDVLVPLSSGPAGTGVQWLKGVGGGAVAASQTAYATFGNASAPADLDGDGDLDLVQGHSLFSGPASLDSVLNGGAGVFTLHSTLVTGGVDLRGVAAADFDLDGAPDAVATCFSDDSLRTARGDGAGGLLHGFMAIVPTGPVGVLAAELSGDDRPDVAVCTPGADAVHVLRANDARLRLAPSTSAPAGSFPSTVRLADLDHDGHLDAVTANASQDVVNVLLGNGSGGFLPKTSFAAGDGAVDVDFGDLDGDGDLDAVVAAQNADAVEVLLGNGAGGFAAPVPTPSLDLVSMVRVRDFDGDGKPDVLARSPTVAGLQLLHGDGAGGLSSPTTIPLPAVATVAVGDVDGDFDTDFVTATSATQDVRVWLNDGTGAFSAQTAVRTGTSPASPQIADLDDDGRADVAVTTGNTGFQAGTVAVLRGDGAGGLAAPVHVATPLLLTLRAADLNGDGRPDLFGASLYVIATTSPATTFEQLHVLTADGDGGFTAPSTEADVAGYSGLDVGDVDGDGRTDVVMTNEADGVVLVALNASAPHPWHDVGSALAGAHGPPSLAGVGWAQAGTAGALELHDAAALATAVLFVSPVSTPTPFKGGVLLPVPPALAVPLVTDAQGAVVLGWSSWPTLTAGSTYWLQAAIADAAAPHGVSLSNGVELVQP